MANIKISQLPSATTPLSGTEEIAIVQNNQTVKTTAESIRGGYKVYTALLTQNGGDNLQYKTSSPLDIGVTYRIGGGDAPGDFTNVGAPNNDLGTYFVATGTTPNAWNDAELEYNTGAPVVTVLENTIGNVWFTYVTVGVYQMNSNSLFTQNKTIGFAGGQGFSGNSADPIFTMAQGTIDVIEINTPSGNDGYLNGAPIEIRVYN